jgi:hypothetical protein
MQATITLGKDVQDRIEQQIERRSFGRSETKYVKIGEDITYKVGLVLDLTEEERSTVLEYGLGQIELENFATYTAEEIAQHDRDAQARVDAIGGSSQRAYNSRAISKQTNDIVHEWHAKDRTIIRVADFFTNPYVRQFKTHYEAVTYARRLKSQLLPRLRQLMEEVRSVPVEERFEV